MKEAIGTAAVGALAFVVSQLFAPGRWFLNSGGGIIATLVVLAVVAIVMQVLDRSLTFWRPVWLATGTTIAFVGYLFAIGGPGNLFPIVIVMGLGMVIPTVLIAGCIGVVVGIFVRRE
jgi:hypothetical protein